jgi:hypothetical protein
MLKTDETLQETIVDTILDRELTGQPISVGEKVHTDVPGTVTLRT